MKKLITILLFVILLTGCQNVNKSSADKIISNAVDSKKDYTNVVRVGYKYYKPSLMSIIESTEYNEVLRSNDKLYYLYIDVIGYYNKVKYNYVENELAYYSKSFSRDNKEGYIEINELKDNQYLIEIVYNYAKIEVMVDKASINEAIAYASSIISSIKYNDVVINKKLGTTFVNSYEETIDLFKKKKNDSTTLKIVESDHYDKDVIPDMDLVN